MYTVYTPSDTTFGYYGSFRQAVDSAVQLGEGSSVYHNAKIVFQFLPE